MATQALKRVAPKPVKAAIARKPNAKRETSAPSPRTVSVPAIRKALGVNRKLFSRLSGYSERAIAQWESGTTLGDASRQRMIELKRLVDALGQVMQASFIGDWLQVPNDAFAGLKPIEVIERGEVDRLWRMIHVLESGQPD